MKNTTRKHNSEEFSGASIKDVLTYWNTYPVHSLEFFGEPDTKVYFDSIDQVRWLENELWSKAEFYGLSGNSNTHLLDAGCGNGVFTRFYARRGFKVTALDLTDAAVQITKKGLELNNLSANVRQGSVEALPFDDNSFDYVVSNGVIHHTPGTEKAVHEFYRVLKPGGKASIAVYYKSWLLRYPFWMLTRSLVSFFLKPAHGREKLFKASTPDQFVKHYDGNDTPIAKSYAKKEMLQLFKLSSTHFSILKMEPHCFPVRFTRFVKRGGWLHYFLDHYCGCMLYILLEKK